MQRTNIEYLDYTWNPIAMRCSPVSSGCDHCWHLRMAARMAGNPALADDRRRAYRGGKPVLLREELTAPFRLRNPARIGVQFMGDLFHPHVRDEYRRAVFGVMVAQPQHLFVVLTKRPGLMLEWSQWLESSDTDPYTACHFSALMHDDGRGAVHSKSENGERRLWPLPNVWLGVSIENQDMANTRVPELLLCPADHRWASVEPMLGPVVLDALAPNPEAINALRCSTDPMVGNKIDWIVCGGETGPGARPMAWDWARQLRDQCIRTKMPFFFKQVGGNSKDPQKHTLDGKVWHQTPDSFMWKVRG